MDYQKEIERKLSQAFNPSVLEVLDESYKHAGHAGADPDKGQTHFKVRIVSTDFEGLLPVASHRKIYQVLSKELQEHVHALSLEVN
tara:strand:+ start:213 stop:470 length:258 start_codon:yes stop_codon:yes gene_type:complete